MPITTRSSPAGCIIMITGLTALIFGLVAGFGAWKMQQAADPKMFEEVLPTMKWSCGISLAMGFALLIIGWRLGRTVRRFDIDDLE
jgi:hypothetical protein